MRVWFYPLRGTWQNVSYTLYTYTPAMLTPMAKTTPAVYRTPARMESCLSHGFGALVFLITLITLPLPPRARPHDTVSTCN